MKYLSALFYLAGVILFIGTAGSSDMGMLCFSDIVLRCTIAFALLGAGYGADKLSERLKNRQTKAKATSIEADILLKRA